MKFGSLFSGIGGFDLGFERAGMTCSWQCEIDKNCQEVLKKQFGVKIYDDVKTITGDNAEPVDLICGGFPCQDLSVAGKRAGLAGQRSGLWFEFHRILSELKPRWVIIENVPGLLSSNKGRDFAILLSGLADIGYLSAWRVLDAQYFGVAQRRRRVFIIGSLGNGGSAQILFEQEGVRWNPPSRRKDGKGIAYATLDNTSSHGKGFGHTEVANTLENQSNSNMGIAVYDMEHAQDVIREYIGISPTLQHRIGTGGNNIPITAHAILTREGMRFDPETETLLPLSTGVRRLTPTECARLQGFPEDWNDWQADTSRYKQFGNAVCVNVAEWLGKRVMMYDRETEG